MMSEATGYSMLRAWEVWNFMSIEHARLDFDEQNIVNIKGYNDSGKSACLQALRVLFTNSDSKSQVKFIQDDKDFFRIVAYFDDGIAILRDKYKNGQSLYEVYKDGEEKPIYSTKVDGHLTKISEVPEPIQQYLGLVLFDGASLNIRSCFEKQLGVQTTGSENYQMFNQVLKSEELSTATILLNTDKNRQAQVVSGLENSLNAQRELEMTLNAVPENIIAGLKELDSTLDTTESRQSTIDSIGAIESELSQVEVIPELPTIDTTQIDVLNSVVAIDKELANIDVLPELHGVDTIQLSALAEILGIQQNIATQSAESLSFEIPTVTADGLGDLIALKSMNDYVASAEKEKEDLEYQLNKVKDDIYVRVKGLEAVGEKVTQCPNCGAVHLAGGEQTCC